MSKKEGTMVPFLIGQDSLAGKVKGRLLWWLIGAGALAVGALFAGGLLLGSLTASAQAPTPAFPAVEGFIELQIDCTASPETSRIRNATDQDVSLNGWTLGSLYQPGAGEPFPLPEGVTLPGPGGLITLYTGPGAPETQTLSPQLIYNNDAAGEGARLTTTQFGTLEVLCSEGTGTIGPPGVTPPAAAVASATYTGSIEQPSAGCGGGTASVTVSGDGDSVVAAGVTNVSADGSTFSQSATFPDGAVPIAAGGSFEVYFTHAGVHGVTISGTFDGSNLTGSVLVDPSTCGPLSFSAVAAAAATPAPTVAARALPSTGGGSSGSSGSPWAAIAVALTVIGIAGATIAWRRRVA